MPIRIQCGVCSKVYRVKDELAGRAIVCKECGEHINVPKPGGQRKDATHSRPKTQPTVEANDSLYEFDVSRLTAAGWGLGCLSTVIGVACIFVVIAAVGGMKAGDRGSRKLLGFLGLGIGVAVFLGGRLLLRKLGIAILKDKG